MNSRAELVKEAPETQAREEKAEPAEISTPAGQASAASSAAAAVPPTSDAAIAVDTEEEDDGDSAVGVSLASTSMSLTSSILKYRQENGRTYHAYKDGSYPLPNDEAENDRLDLQHHLFALTFDGELCLCPAGRDKQVQRVLDAGTGTGIWAMDYADMHPEAEVVGIDLSPVQPSFVPPNVSFFIDDLEAPWNYSSKFDFIYARMLTGSINDWPKLVGQCYDFLNPGGWVEITDFSFPVTSDDGSLPSDSALRRWSDLMVEAAAKLNRDINSAKHRKKWLKEKGFINVTELIFKWPQNTWPKAKKYKEIGMWTYENMSGSLSGLSMALFTRGLGWTKEALEVFLVDVRKDMRDRSRHSYWCIYVVYGQKPE